MMRTLYRLMLQLFLPRTLRDAHSADMQALFAEQLSEARTNGRFAEFRIGMQGILDVARRAPREHWNRSGPVHSQNKEHPVQAFLIDLRQTFRSFARQPGATALILVTLALAVAANTTVFSLLDGVFRRPFPLPNPNRLVYLNERAPTWNLEYANINFPDFVAWRERAKAFESVALFEFDNVNLAEHGSAERALALRVTYDFAAVLKLPFVLGRNFTASEDVPNGSSVVIISNALWKSRFGGASDVINKTLRINSAPFTIVGVLSAAASFPDEAALWLPLGGDPKQGYQNYSFDGIGRLKPGVTVAQAQKSLFDAHTPIWAARDTSRAVVPRVEPLRDRFVADYVDAGETLGISAAIVLLIACANVAGTMLARSITRRKEIDIRVALGASSSRIVRQLLTESLVLSVVAGAIGTIVAQLALTTLTQANPTFLPAWARPAVDLPSVAFSIVVVAIAALLFGLAPALQLRRHVIAGGSMANARIAGSVPERRMLNALVVTEVALAAVLLVSGGLLLRAYDSLRNVNPGFKTDGVATFRVALPSATYPNGVPQFALYDRLIEQLRAIPGVDHVGGVSCLPLTCNSGNFLKAENVPPPLPGALDPVTQMRIATPDYFASMGIVLAKGRLFRANEGNALRDGRVALINEQLAARFWPNADAIGKRFAFRGDTSNNWITVVGVVKDVRHFGLGKPIAPAVYVARTSIDSTDNWAAFGFTVHTTGSLTALLPALRKTVSDIDAELPVFELQTAEALLNHSMSQQRMIAFSLAVFATVALGLAVGGIYAVLSYVVGRRRREIAIRMAVGAQRGQVLAMVMQQGVKLIAIGVALGIPAAIATTRSMKTLLAGVSEQDPAVYVGAILLLTIIGAGAAAIPAMRAARLDPKDVLAEAN